MPQESLSNPYETAAMAVLALCSTSKSSYVALDFYATKIDILVKVSKKSYIVNKKGLVLRNKKAVKVGKKTYKINKYGIATRKK